MRLAPLRVSGSGQVSGSAACTGSRGASVTTCAGGGRQVAMLETVGSSATCAGGGLVGMGEPVGGRQAAVWETGRGE